MPFKIPTPRAGKKIGSPSKHTLRTIASFKPTRYINSKNALNWVVVYHARFTRFF